MSHKLPTEPRNRASVEYVAALVTADVTIDTQPIQMAVTRAQPVDADWQTATWVGSPGTTREARLEPFTPAGTGPWQVFVRITDSPEILVVHAGELYLT